MFDSSRRMASSFVSDRTSSIQVSIFAIASAYNMGLICMSAWRQVLGLGFSSLYDRMKISVVCWVASIERGEGVGVDRDKQKHRG